MSMFNDMSWGSRDNKIKCESNVKLVSLFARTFGARQWAIPRSWFQRKSGLLSVKKVHKENGTKIAELVMFKFGESGHPVFRYTSPMSRGMLRSKGGGKLSIRFCADEGTIATVFRTIISVSQLSVFTGQSQICVTNP